MKKKRLLQIVSVIALMLSLIILWGYRSGRKAKELNDLPTQLDSAIKIQTNLQVLAILQQDSIDKFADISVDTAFKRRHDEILVGIAKNEKDVSYLIRKTLAQP